MSTQQDGKDCLDVFVDNGKAPLLDIKVASGGQEDKLGIAFRMAMLELGAANNGSVLGMLVMDEPTKFIDDEGKDALADLLYRCAADKYPCVYIVSHDGRFADAFPRRMAVESGPDQTAKLRKM